MPDPRDAELFGVFKEEKSLAGGAGYSHGKDGARKSTWPPAAYALLYTMCSTHNKSKLAGPMLRPHVHVDLIALIR